MIKKNELNRFGKNWRIHNSYIQEFSRYKPWLEHRHGKEYREVVVFAHTMHCIQCDKRPPKVASAIFEMILRAYEA